MDRFIDVIVVGELNVDLILNAIDGFPEMGKEKLANEMILTLGSSSAIFASNLSSLGTKVSFIGKIGQDIFGDLIIERLQSKSVKTDLITRSRSLKTGATIVLNFDEDRAMITHPGAMEDLRLDDISEKDLKEARHMHLSSYFLQPGLRKNIVDLFIIAKKAGLTTSFDAQWDPEEKWDLDLEKLLPYVDVFLPNEQEMLYMTNSSSLEAALKKTAPFAHIIAIKRGNKGSLVYSEGQSNQEESFLNKNVVDAIGAGDSFNAGFIYKFIQGNSIRECQIFGNLTGAISTTAAGGTTAFKDYQTVLKTARDQFGYTEPTS